MAAATVAPDEAAASADAVTGGVPVEALSDRTEYARTFANPDGTFTYQVSPVQQPVQLSDSTWVNVDTTLQAQPDGTIAPAASPGRRTEVDNTFITRSCPWD